jgi:single-strand selective monofunctional uracil DNA glycosylase
MVVDALLRSAASLRDDAEALAEGLVTEGAVDCVYNPLSYAWEVHEAYLRKAGGGGARTLLLGMNPGPHGMGQMGIPFAATSVVRDLLGIRGIGVGQPSNPHPKRPVNGLEHPKEEVSGTRLWGVLAERYGTAEAIFEHVFLVNHCPLMLFSGPRAANVTPDKVRGPSVTALLERCDQHLREVVAAMAAETVIGVGRYAESRATSSLKDLGTRISSCWHPSPASPLANRNGGADWRANVLAVLP